MERRWPSECRNRQPIRFPAPDERLALTRVLAAAGFVAADEEADELLARAGGDGPLLASLVERRLAGEPLAWIIGTVLFAGIEIRVDPGVYVPRWQSTPLAERALARLPETGLAIDLCTGAGAIARLLMAGRPGARVLATEIDDRAVACATANGVEVYQGDLFAPLPDSLEGVVDVVVSRRSLCAHVGAGLVAAGHPGLRAPPGPRRWPPTGPSILRRVVNESPRYLRPGGALLLELGAEEADLLADDLAGRHFTDVDVLIDEDGDVRGIEATYAPTP